MKSNTRDITGLPPQAWPCTVYGTAPAELRDELLRLLLHLASSAANYSVLGPQVYLSNQKIIEMWCLV